MKTCSLTSETFLGILNQTYKPTNFFANMKSVKSFNLLLTFKRTLQGNKRVLQLGLVQIPVFEVTCFLLVSY